MVMKLREGEKTEGETEGVMEKGKRKAVEKQIVWQQGGKADGGGGLLDSCGGLSQMREDVGGDNSREFHSIAGPSTTAVADG